jgi:hypothetical protein
MLGYLYGKRFGSKNSCALYLFTDEDGTECSETLAFKVQVLVNHPEESRRHSEHSKSLKSRIVLALVKL